MNLLPALKSLLCLLSVPFHFSLFDRRINLIPVCITVLLPFLANTSWADEKDDVCSIYNSSRTSPLVESKQDGLWSDPETWGGKVPEVNDDVAILHAVIADFAEAREIQIQGAELVLDGEIHAHGSLIVCKNAILSGAKGTIAFHVPNDRLFTGNEVSGPVPAYAGFHPKDIGLWALPEGSIELIGPTVTSWLDAVQLDPKARPRSLYKGVSKLLAFDKEKANLASAPLGWKVGDQILLVSEKGDDALALLESISGTEITYKLMPGEDPVTANILIPEIDKDNRRVHPKVANLSRRIQIVSAEVSEGDTNHRSHTAFLKGSHIVLKGVEFRNLGPRAKLGRYPIHWHHARATEDILDGSSIWQSVDDGGNRFVTLHMVSGVRVSNNVGYRSQGHGYFMEEIMEFDNEIMGNLSVDVRYGEELPNVDSGISGQTHHYWLRASNTISGNVAAGFGGRSSPLEGLVVLPSSKPDNAPVVTDFECLGCGELGMWTAVPYTLFVNPKSSYATLAGFRSRNAWNFKVHGTVLDNPLFILNGSNDLVKKPKGSAGAWASQIFLNHGTLAMKGGTLIGHTGLHVHYRSTFEIKDTRIITDTFVVPTYWETAGVVEDSYVQTKTLFHRGYGGRRVAPGIITFANTCVNKKCLDSDRLRISKSYTDAGSTSFFPDSTKGKSNQAWIQLPEVAPLTGYISRPDEYKSKYWSVTPASNKNKEGPVKFIREHESAWSKSLGINGGYIHGFPPGEYRVSLYADDDKSSLLASGTVSVSSGLISEICFEDESLCASR